MKANINQNKIASRMRHFIKPFLAAMMAVGLLLSFQTFAATTISLASIEGESMQPMFGTIGVVNDARASNNKALALWGSAQGYAMAGFSTQVGPTSVMLRLRGNLCQGQYPVYKVNVDGQPRGSGSLIRSDWHDYVVPLGYLAGGSHRVDVGFMNDYYGPNCDRNMFIDRITLNGVATPTPTPSDDPSTKNWTTLTGITHDATAATAAKYDLKDNRGFSMDTLKVTQAGPASYVGVYHSTNRGETYVATSSNLVTWTYRATLDTHATQPFIAATTDGYVVAYEQDTVCLGGGNCVAFRHYSSLEKLLQGYSDKFFRTTRQFSDCAEGTPNIYSVNAQQIKVGFHFFANCYQDSQASGTLTNFNSWTAQREDSLDQQIRGTWPGFKGNVGDRDEILFNGYKYRLFEAQIDMNSWGTWRIVTNNETTNQFGAIVVKTPNGSKSMANPSITSITSPQGKPAVLVTYFIHSEGAGVGEAGQLLYYKEL